MVITKEGVKTQVRHYLLFSIILLGGECHHRPPYLGEGIWGGGVKWLLQAQEGTSRSEVKEAGCLLHKAITSLAGKDSSCSCHSFPELLLIHAVNWCISGFSKLQTSFALQLASKARQSCLQMETCAHSSGKLSLDS